MKKAVLIIPAADFRDEELFDTREMLSNNSISVKIASTTTSEVKGMLGGLIKPDILLSDLNTADFDLVVFIGGQGAEQYWDDTAAHQICRQVLAENKILGAICIAPVTLARAGVLKGKRATVWPSLESELDKHDARSTGRAVEQDGRIITATGPDAVGDFAAALVKEAQKPGE